MSTCSVQWLTGDLPIGSGKRLDGIFFYQFLEIHISLSLEFPKISHVNVILPLHQGNHSLADSKLHNVKHNFSL